MMRSMSTTENIIGSRKPTLIGKLGHFPSWQNLVDKDLGKNEGSERNFPLWLPFIVSCINPCTSLKCSRRLHACVWPTAHPKRLRPEAFVRGLMAKWCGYNSFLPECAAINARYYNLRKQVEDERCDKGKTKRNRKKQI